MHALYATPRNMWLRWAPGRKVPMAPGLHSGDWEVLLVAFDRRKPILAHVELQYL